MQGDYLLAAPLQNGQAPKEVKYPRKVKEGWGMDYTGVAFPKPGNKKKKRSKT